MRSAPGFGSAGAALSGAAPEEREKGARLKRAPFLLGIAMLSGTGKGVVVIAALALWAAAAGCQTAQQAPGPAAATPAVTAINTPSPVPTPTPTPTPSPEPTATPLPTGTPVPTAVPTQPPTPRAATATPIAPTPAPPPPAGNAQNGRQIFLTAGCSTCHQADGSGLVGPRIANTNLSFAEVLRQLRSPRESMPMFGPETVSDQQARDIYAFLKSLP